MKDEEGNEILPCPKKCMKEINPEEHPGVYFGKPFVYDPNWGACWMCQREERKRKERKRNEDTKETI